jgi:glycyl-tRNA synthetase
MVKDKTNGTCYRADHLIKKEAEKIIEDKKATSDLKTAMEDILIRLDGLSCEEMDGIITKFAFKSPEGNELSSPVAFNLMFPTSIGPTGDVQAYLRPETAQGIFINFKRLLEFNQAAI